MITTADKSEEFLRVYEEACELYAAEGGTGTLSKSHVKVYNYSFSLTSRIVFKMSASEK